MSDLRWTRLSVLIIAFGCAMAVSVAVASPASAIGGGAGASGSGDEIITSILAAKGHSPGGSGGSGGTAQPAPSCRTHVLTDRQIVFLLHVASNMPELLESSFLDAIREYSNTTVVASGGTTPPTTEPPDPPTQPPGPGTQPPGPTTEPSVTTTTAPVVAEATVTYWELTVRICDGVADTMSVRPRTTGGADVGAAVLAGSLLRNTTRLPPPTLVVSPPPRTGPTGVVIATIVGEPVFFSARSIPPVRHSTNFAGRTVDVEADPDHLELFSGQPGSADRVQRCEGLGVPFDPNDDRTVRTQASDPRRCVLFFERATGGGSRSTWTGYAALNWNGRYRVDGGPWRTLDGLFSTAVFDVGVGEVETLIQTP
ncbi:MAG: hypothetical protein ACK5O2_10400 [Microthrixaceae bacterium]